MRNIILTGTAGSGKTSILYELKAKGYIVVDEAVTDLIQEKQRSGDLKPWENPFFIEEIIALQKNRQIATQNKTFSDIIFYDRSPICTYALCIFLKIEIPQVLRDEINRIQDHYVYDKTVFFITNVRLLNIQMDVK